MSETGLQRGINVTMTASQLRNAVLMQRGKAICADDEDPVLDAVTGQMKALKLGYDTARDGREAIAQVIRNSYDVATLDIRMGDLWGHTAAETIRCLRPRLPIIKVTAFGEQHVGTDRFETRGIVLLHNKADGYEKLGDLTKHVVRYRQTMDALLGQAALRRKYIAHLNGVVSTVSSYLFDGERGGAVVPELLDDTSFASELFNMIGDYVELNAVKLAEQGKPFANAMTAIQDARNINDEYDPFGEFDGVVLEINSLDAAVGTVLAAKDLIVNQLKGERNNYLVDDALKRMERAMGEHFARYEDEGLLSICAEFTEESGLPEMTADNVEGVIRNVVHRNVLLDYDRRVNTKQADVKYDADAAMKLVGAANIALTNLLHYTTGRLEYSIGESDEEGSGVEEATDTKDNVVRMDCVFFNNGTSVGFEVSAPTTSVRQSYFDTGLGKMKQPGLEALEFVVQDEKDGLGGTLYLRKPQGDDNQVKYRIEIPLKTLMPTEVGYAT